MGLFHCFALFLIVLPFSTLCSLLETNDIYKTVNKLVQYHVDTHEVTAPILVRSIESYANAFDLNRAYLTRDEIDRHSHSKQQLLKEYRDQDLTSYRQLNATIQESILRARSWRAVWSESPLALIEAASHRAKREKKRSNRLEEVKERHHEMFLSYIALYLADAPEGRYLGREAELVQLCQRQIENHENPYLGINDQGKPMSKEEEAHYFHTRIIKAIAHSLDAHTAYFSKDEAAAMRVQLEKGMCGIGIILKEDIDGIIIKEIVSGGPADKSGQLAIGDILDRINGESTQGLSFLGVLEKLRGEQGSQVTLQVRRGQRVHSVQLKRSKILLEDKRVDVSYEPYGNGVIGKITLYAFYEGEHQISSEQDLRRAIQSLKDKNLLGLVLDIRENTGGFLSQAIKVSGLFMTNGVVVISKYADGSIKRYRSISSKKFYDGPLAILVSKSSASAAEIVAQTLQDYGVAIIVGDEQTYGKGTIQHQTITGNSNEGFFKVTVGKYYSPSGRSPQLQGVKSDIVIASRYAEESLGERFLDHPLPTDYCENVLVDNLDDLSPNIRPWFQKYYLPQMQHTETTWQMMLPQLIANSHQRLKKNKNYSLFLEMLKQPDEDEKYYGSNDIQMEESVNIVKDMIFLRETLSKGQTAP